MELSPRLRSIGDQVPGRTRFADVGTDHAYLPVWLILQGVVEHAIAADLREGPLERARKTAEQYGVAERISFRLCDGLSGIRADEADTIAIAGMGGDTIASILTAAPWTKQEGKLLLLQPMTAQPDLRQWLGVHGYTIVEERISREANRLYSIWTVRGGIMPELSPGELWAGKQSRDALRGEYLDYIAAKVSRALMGHMAAVQPEAETIAGLQETLNDLLRMKGEWLSWQ